MLVLATSDKGGTGRSVTSVNMTYRLALQGDDVCYVDYDFGSPTAGAVFDIGSALTGVSRRGLHSHLHGRIAEPVRIDVWADSDRSEIRDRPPGAGQLVLLPGDEGGGEFPVTAEMVQRCALLLLRLDEEFDLVLVDLSAGRSYAIELVLAAMARPELRSMTVRWLVFHRWTRQHIIAAAGLVYGERGILEQGERLGHDRRTLNNTIRFVRTAVVDPEAADQAALRPAQAAWLQECNHNLLALAAERRLGRIATLASVPLDPVLQWREQLISDADVYASRIANPGTVAAFEELAKKVLSDPVWEGL